MNGGWVGDPATTYFETPSTASLPNLLEGMTGWRESRKADVNKDRDGPDGGWCRWRLWSVEVRYDVVVAGV